MTLRHEDIKDKLPEILREGGMPDHLKMHLEKCSECTEEIFLLHVLHRDSVPEPGNMFFETLPAKIRLSLKKKRNIFFWLAPSFALISLIITAGYIHYFLNAPQLNSGYSFSDPFAPKVYDLSDVHAEYVPSIADTIEGTELYISGETNYQREFVSLSPEEMEFLYNSLAMKGENGGVL